MAAPETQRRLATIVVIDAAGYSRQSEIDETVAVREITALSERIHASAASRRGRVFNTAGDGFMLEFPSAAAAVAAAEEMQSVDRVPLRIGIHVGEIHETSTGDLLGKEVNVAARLMALAEPGSIFISGDAKRALSADIVARLHSRGMVHLDKMSERIEAHELGSPWRRPPTVSLRWVLFGAGAVAVAIAGWIGAQMLLRPSSQAIAVLEFRALEPGLEGFAVGLADRVVGTMSTRDLLPAHSSAAADEDRMAAASETGAAFALDGSVRPDGDELLVNARLVDMRGNVAIWSSEYRRASSEQNYMQEQIAADVARVLHCALIGSRGSAGGIAPTTLSLFLRACDRMDNLYDNLEETHQIARQVTEGAPRFSRGWSMRAASAAQLSFSGGSPEEAQAFRAEALEAAARARRLDATNGESYLAEALLLPHDDWRGRQALIDRALAADPDLAAAHAARGVFYLQVGRARDALGPMRRAVAIEPLNPDLWTDMIPVLSVNGEQLEANELRERLYRTWPNSEGAWWNRFLNATHVGDPADAVRMLDDMESAPVQFHPLAETRWRAFLLARQSGNPTRVRAAALALRDLIPGKFARSSVAAALSSAGEVDASFEIMEAALQLPNYSAGVLFMPPWANLWRDPRFMTLLRDTGLIEYWREAGRWPDFCAAADLPYDCEAEAARVLPP